MIKKRYLSLIVIAVFTISTIFALSSLVMAPAAEASGSGGLPGGGLARKCTLSPSGPGDYPTIDGGMGALGGSGGGCPSATMLSTNYLPPVGDQGAQGSCAGWATAYYGKTYMEAREHGWNTSKKNRRFSPAYLYNQVNGGADNGTTMYEILSCLKETGCVDLEEFPYRSSDYTTQPTASQYEAAKPYRVESFAAFWTSPGGNGLGEFKRWLAGGQPILLAVPVYESFYDPEGSVIGAPGYGEYYLGGHAITAVGYDDSVGGVKIVNSWGQGWGDSGYAYLTYDFVSNWAWEAWAITDRACDTPIIHHTSSDQGRPGMDVTIEGTDFGTDRGESAVLFGDCATQAQSWNNQKITVKVPQGVNGDGIRVRNWAGESSGQTAFVVDPSIYSVGPEVAAPGDIVTIYGSSLGSEPNKVLFGSTEAEIESWSPSAVRVKVPDLEGQVDLMVRTRQKDSNKLSFEAVGSVWYLAEGCSGWGFEEFLCIENTEGEAGSVEITYMTPEGPVEKPAFGIAGQSRVTIPVHDDLPNSDVSVRVISDVRVVVERSMYWNGRIEGHVSPGVRGPSDAWYLSEGCTGYGFDTWVLVQNPNPEPVTVDVTYLTPEGPQEREPLEVAANSRQSIHVNDEVPDEDVSVKVEAERGVVVERSMYWEGRRGGHNSEGSATAQKTWYLAEGSTMYGFDEWVLVANPSDSDATVQIEYMTAGGPVPRAPMVVPANSRRTVHVNDDLQVPEVSVKVTADRDVIAERAMYWNAGSGKAGHGALAAREPSEEVFLAEGCTGYGFDTWVLVQNPNPEDVTVDLVLVNSGGPQGTVPMTLEGCSRQSVHVNEWLADSDVSVKVSAQSPVIVERAMYWGEMQGGHDAPGVSF